MKDYHRPRLTQPGPGGSVTSQLESSACWSEDADPKKATHRLGLQRTERSLEVGVGEELGKSRVRGRRCCSRVHSPAAAEMSV